jgi:N-acetylneuraminate epimerase
MKNYSCYLLFLMMIVSETLAQPAIQWSELPVLPGGKGWAGMYAGVSHNNLIVMGGANFPDKYPWEGGKKKWSDEIYVLQKGKSWEKLAEKLPVPSGYGVSVSYKNKIILVGGSNENGHLNRVVGFEWDGKTLQNSVYPDLPIPLANMAGQLVNDLIVIFGGMESPTGVALKKCLALDMNDLSKGWFELEAWPGAERLFPVCTYYKGQSYLFGGETTAVNSLGNKYRSILLDCFSLALTKENGSWKAAWKKLATMPRGMSAGGTILPVLNNDRFLFWGGVDAVTGSYKTPATHPGIIQSLLYYFPETDSWEYIGEQTKIASRVTLPVVHWNDQWWYISGEVKPGIRTPTVVGVR